MRPVIELLQIMRNNPQLFRSGLCPWASELFLKGLITFDENLRLSGYIQDHPPRGVLDESFFWWRHGDIEPRLEWINYHLNNDIDD